MSDRGLVKCSRRRVLIILVVLSGSFLAFNYLVLSCTNVRSYYSSLLRRRLIISPNLTSTPALSNNKKSAAWNTSWNNRYLITSSSAHPQASSVNIQYTKVEIESSSSHLSSSANAQEVVNDTQPEDGDSSTSSDTDYFSEVKYNQALDLDVELDLNTIISFPCKNSTQRRVRKRNKNLIVFENFIPALASVKCHESITYTTHGDYRYLDNLIPLVERWDGPISVAVYAPGEDLKLTLHIISYLRECATRRISLVVSFHLFFDTKYTELKVGKDELQFGWLDSLYEKEKWGNCRERPNLHGTKSTFRMNKHLLYPVNIARNIARSAAPTHYVLASDIELYPSLDVIPSFFRMLRDQENELVLQNSKKVFVLPIFEIKKGNKPPLHKRELVTLLNNKLAIPFHNFICPECHLIPRYAEWKKMVSYNSSSAEQSLQIFHVAKRKPPFQFWEPIYIGTKYEPPYDERLSWEGLRDKMTQGYILCALDYKFMILDNAFLVHRPGIKRLTHRITKTVLRQDRLINLRIKAELFRRFGKQNGCVL